MAATITMNKLAAFCVCRSTNERSAFGHALTEAYVNACSTKDSELDGHDDGYRGNFVVSRWRRPSQGQRYIHKVAKEWKKASEGGPAETRINQKREYATRRRSRREKRVEEKKSLANSEVCWYLVVFLAFSLWYEKESRFPLSCRRRLS